MYYWKCLTSDLNSNVPPVAAATVKPLEDDKESLLEQRKLVLKEILMTERNYVADLSVLVCFFFETVTNR